MKSKVQEVIYLSHVIASKRSWKAGSNQECKSVRSKVVSIEGRLDRQKSIRSKTRVSSIEDCNYCLSVLNLLFIKSV